MVKAFAQCNAALKSSPGLTFEDGELVEATCEAVSRTENRGGGDVGWAIGMPLELVVRRGGGGALARVFPNVAARCLRSRTIGTIMAAVEKASFQTR